MKRNKFILLALLVAPLLWIATACSDDDNEVVNINWEDATVKGTWGLDTVKIENSGNGTLHGLTPQNFKSSWEGATVVFDGTNMTVSKNDQQLEQRTYIVKRFYIKLGTSNLATDTLYLYKISTQGKMWVQLRQFTDHTHHHYTIYHINKK